MIKREVQPKRYIQYLELSRTYPSLQLHFRGAFVRIEMSEYSEVAKAVESKAIFIGPDAQAFLGEGVVEVIINHRKPCVRKRRAEAFTARAKLHLARRFLARSRWDRPQVHVHLLRNNLSTIRGRAEKLDLVRKLLPFDQVRFALVATLVCGRFAEDGGKLFKNLCGFSSILPLNCSVVL